MNILSLFDGMSCGKLALQRANIIHDNYFASEIDKYCIAISKKNFSDIIHIGNVCDVTYKKLPRIDCVIGGSPCQGFSFAGKGLNFKDPRSALFFEYVRILEETNPKYFLLENVNMKKDHQDVITRYLGIEPIEINSNLFSAQNRKRLYWTNINVDLNIIDKNIFWGDIREYGVSNRKYYYTKKALQWLGRQSRKKKRLLTIHRYFSKMQMLEASHYKKYSSQRFFGIADFPNDTEIKNSMNENYRIVNEYDDMNLGFEHDKVLNCLCSLNSKEEKEQFTLKDTIYSSDIFLRYVTPLECERLQTVPDYYTSGISDSQRYKMLGNGWTVDVISFILRNIN